MGQINNSASLSRHQDILMAEPDNTRYINHEIASKLNLSLEKMSSSAHANKTESGAIIKAVRNNECYILITCVLIALIIVAISLLLIGKHEAVACACVALVLVGCILLIFINLKGPTKDSKDANKNIHAEIDTAEESIYEEIGPAEESIYEEPIHAEIDGAMFTQQPVYSLLGEHVNGAGAQQPVYSLLGEHVNGAGAQQPVYSLLGESTGPIGPFEQSIYSLLAERGNIKLHRHKDS